MNKSDIEIILTEDGSHTLYSNKFKSTYHSTKGAIQESQHVFISAGLDHLTSKSGKTNISILEIGLGTGLNAFMSLLYSKEHQIKVDYHALEKYPIDSAVAAALNYPEQLKAKIFQDLFLELHSTNSNKRNLTDNFSFLCTHISFEEHCYPSQQYDLVYFDPFDAAAHERVWQESFLSELTQSLKVNGVLITYGAKGSFKRALKALGMEVESLPGPPGKREITRATKTYTSI